MTTDKNTKEYRKAERLAFESQRKLDDFVKRIIDKPVKKDNRTVGIVTNAYVDQNGDVMGEYSMIDGTKLKTKIISNDTITIATLK